MRRLTRTASILALTGVAALALASCGGSGDELLPGDTAQEINENLDRVGALADAGDCVGAEEATAEVAAQVEDAEIDTQLKEALEKGVDKLSAAVDGCQEGGEGEAPEPLDTTAEEPEETEEEKTKPDREKNQQPDKPSDEREEEPEGGGEETSEAQPAEPESESESGGVAPAAPAEGE